MPTNSSRAFKCTLHNVDPQVAQAEFDKWIKSQDTIWGVSTPEPNPEDVSRFHIHVFVIFKNQRRIDAVKNKWRKAHKIPGVCLPPPPGETREWNNWWVRPMEVKEIKKTAEACLDYLRGATKDKPLGVIHEFKKRPCGRRVRLNPQTRKNEEFCFYCTQADCLGCCQGCFICTPTTGHDELIRRNAIISSENAIKRSLKENRKKRIIPGDGPFDYPKIEYL